jgi:hypothetical protein
MSDFLEERIKTRYYNPDGTMKPEYLEKLRSQGMSEVKIDQLEQIHIRDAKLDLEVQQLQQQLEHERAEVEAQWEQERLSRDEERAHLNIAREKVSPSISSNEVDTSSMTPLERRAHLMNGLNREELLSQGFVEPDDFYNPADEKQLLDEKEEEKIHVFSDEELGAAEEF